MNKKAQGLSMETIIVAIIVIVVLVVLVLVFTGRMNIFTQSSSDCTAQGGKCISGNSCGSGQVPVKGIPKGCKAGLEICCIAPG